MNKDIERVLIQEDELRSIINRLAEEINRTLTSVPLLVIVTLKGAAPFAMDLIRHLTMPVEIDFIQVSSYGNSTVSTGDLKIIKDSGDVSGKNVLIIEDIIDSGNTLSRLAAMFKDRNAKSVRICTLLDKPSKRQSPVKVDFTGIEIPDVFVVGYGLDYDEKYRNLPYIGILKKEIYQNNT